MNFHEFTKIMECKTQLYLGNEYEVCIQNVTKNNGLELTGIMAKKKGANTFPTIYIDDIYEEEMSLEDIEYAAMKVSRNLVKAEKNLSFDVEDFTDFDKAKTNIALKLINADRNKELLFDVPHRRFHNLAIVYYYLCPGENECGIASILIRSNHIEKWDVNEDELYNIAYENNKRLFSPKLWSMKEILKDLYGGELLEADIPMYVFTNENKMNGAYIMLYKEEMKKVSNDLGGSNLYILPSSIHELIIMPDSEELDRKELLRTVTDINRTQVQTDEVLSDSVYYYDAKLDEVIWAC